jgi:hypothetical protein
MESIMNNTREKNAVNVILGEYARAVLDLKKLLLEIDNETLVAVADSQTLNPDCKSIQTVAAHVVQSGYSYCVYIRESRNEAGKRPHKVFRETAVEFVNDLDNMMQFTRDTFENIYDDELEQPYNSKKMLTRWEQLYDIEQIMEHAIVHVLRHRRQIEKFREKIQSH